MEYARTDYGRQISYITLVMRDNVVPVNLGLKTYILQPQKGSGYSSGTGQIASEANRPVPDE